MLHLIRKVRNSCAQNERVIFFKSKYPRFKQLFKEYILRDIQCMLGENSRLKNRGFLIYLDKYINNLMTKAFKILSEI